MNIMMKSAYLYEAQRVLNEFKMELTVQGIVELMSEEYKSTVNIDVLSKKLAWDYLSYGISKRSVKKRGSDGRINLYKAVPLSS